jgi:hypothetical protein
MKSEVALFANLGSLTGAVTQVVQLGTANIATLHDFDLGNRWGVHWERALDANAVADLANRVRLLNS